MRLDRPPCAIDRRKIVRGAFATAAGLLAGTRPLRAAWPSQVIRLVVPFAPGGSTDVLARAMALRLEPRLGQPIVVENRPGGGGGTAAGQVARASPDGHTLMMGHIGTLALNPNLHAQLPYDPETSFAAVALVARLANIVVVHPGLPVRSMSELIDYARANPGRLNYSSGGSGSAAHVTTAYFAHAAGLRMVHVPYRGTAPSVNDLVGGHVQLTMTGGPAVLPLIADGQLRALAVTSAGRAPFAPELPTIAESALPGFEAVQWYGIVAPAGTPAEIVARLNRELNTLLGQAEIAAVLARDGAIAAPETPEGFSGYIAAERRHWGDIIRRAGIVAG